MLKMFSLCLMRSVLNVEIKENLKILNKKNRILFGNLKKYKAVICYNHRQVIRLVFFMSVLYLQERGGIADGIRGQQEKKYSETKETKSAADQDDDGRACGSGSTVRGYWYI